MNWSFFKKDKAVNQQESNKDRINEIFVDTVHEKRKADPLIGAKIGSKEIINSLINGMKDSKGVHIESLMSALGSLAGYSCQASIRKELIEMKGLMENQVFVIIETTNGSKYYFGDLINIPLVENQLSVWSLAAGAVQSLGISKMIDMQEIFKHVSETVGSDNYGIPRVPLEHKPGDIPLNYLKNLWQVFLPVAEKYCAGPREWPIMFGLAVQEGILMSKDVVDPLLALTIAMESAIPMAKVDIG